MTKNLKRACEFPVKPKPPVRISVLKKLGLILHCFPSASPHVQWVRMCLVPTPDPQLLTDSSTFQSHAAQIPQQCTAVHICFRRGSLRQQQMEGSVDSQ